VAKWDHRKAEALAALDANGGNVNRTARQLGIPESTLRGWKKLDEEQASTPFAAQTREVREFREIREEKKAALADRLETIAHQIVDALGDKIPEANLQQAATSLGIITDKMQLLRNAPTAIHENRDVSEDDRAARIAELLERGRGRRGLAVSDGGGAGGGRATPGAVH